MPLVLTHALVNISCPNTGNDGNYRLMTQAEGRLRIGNGDECEVLRASMIWHTPNDESQATIQTYLSKVGPSDYELSKPKAADFSLSLSRKNPLVPSLANTRGRQASFVHRLETHMLHYYKLTSGLVKRIPEIRSCRF